MVRCHDTSLFPWLNLYSNAFRLEPDEVGMVVDRGHDWPSYVQKDLERYGSDIWMFRDQPDAKTTRALNSYMGDHRRYIPPTAII